MAKVGRPTKYKPEYCQLLIDHMAKGLSFESFAGVVGTCKETIYRWLHENKEFVDARRHAIAKNRIFWEQKGIDGMQGDISGFNATSWVFNMKNRFGWNDRQDINIEATTNIKLNSNKDVIDLIIQARDAKLIAERARALPEAEEAEETAELVGETEE